MTSDRYQRFYQLFMENSSVFEKFRTKPLISERIDRVDPEFGQRYLLYIQLYYPDLYSKLKEFGKNDLIGSPFLVDYPGAGLINPTTLQYIKTYGDLEARFTPLKEKKIVELGGGYGGLCRVLASQKAFKKYTIIDLPEMIALTKFYLESFGILEIEYIEADRVSEIVESDLVISNYVFSKCERRLQENYFHKIIRHSKAGYMIDSFIGQNANLSPYSTEEWLGRLEFCNFKVKKEPEIPSSPDLSNVLFTWAIPLPKLSCLSEAL